MSDKPLKEWTNAELAGKERTYPLGDVYGDELRAEIGRREIVRNRRYVLAGIIVAAVSAFGSMVAAIASLIAVISK